MTDDLLFPVPEVKSPRKLWLEKHAVETKRMPAHLIGTEDEDGIGIPAWVAWVRHEDADTAEGGDTEQEAIRALAVRRRWKLWNEEGYKP
jgi:hypothetical protein